MAVYRTMRYLTWSMLMINLILVLSFCGLQVIATAYAEQAGLSMDLLSMLNKVPGSPTATLWICVLAYLGLSACLLIKKDELSRDSHWRNLLAGLLTLIIIFRLDAAYNGLVLMVFCFYLPTQKSLEIPWSTISFCIFAFLLCQHDVLAAFLPIGNPEAYINVFERGTQSSLHLWLSVLESLNLTCFITYVAVFLLHQYQWANEVEKELEMVSAVNSELQNYAAITEKIGEDKERKRIAREIHDTLGHALTGIAAGIDACLVLIDRDSVAAKKQLQIVSKVVRQGIGDVRNSLNKLRPGALEGSSFRMALEKMIHEFMEVSSLQIHFDYRLEDFDFETTKEDMLFRIIQECITNGLRHGHASEIWISMYSDEDRIILSVRDNGVGCDAVVPGYGLRQMKERVGMMGGRIYHDGSQGFMTIVNLPIEKGESQERKQS